MSLFVPRLVRSSHAQGVRVVGALARLAIVVASLAGARGVLAAGDRPPPPPGELRGLAVVAFPGSTDAAWPLARAIYAEPTLSPALDEPSARALCGEVPARGSGALISDLAAAVAALHGEDAPSRMLLAEIARRLRVRALVTVRAGVAGGPGGSEPVPDGGPVARVFLAETGAFDAATYAPDDPSPESWSAAVRLLVRTYAPAAAVTPTHASLLATHEPTAIRASSSSRPFYESVWFWGALGAAALAGGGFYLATRDTGPSTIHLEAQVH